MSTIVKYVVGHTYKPLLEKYLSRKRVYHYNGFSLEIPPEVFHPGFFFSTRFLMKWVDRLPIQNKSLLELGAGSGLISMHAAARGAIVTSTDLSRTAVDYLQTNSEVNGIDLKIIHSDLFHELPAEKFDFIIINPPYYKREPQTEKELAWCCGSKGEYFERLFEGMGAYMHSQSEALMVLCDGCDLQMIEGMAIRNGFLLDCLSTKKNLIETNFIFRIKKKALVEFKNSREEGRTDLFVEQYFALRDKEGRIYTDEQLSRLPFIEPTHSHAAEWYIRKASAEDLKKYLQDSGAKTILEVGCGNGWLANWLASIPGISVTAIDVNKTELKQGERVFHRTGNLNFVEGDLRNGILEGKKFDAIVFAASIQYFKNLQDILPVAMQYLNEAGSIHIVDSFFYKNGELDAAKERTRKYFDELGFPLMANFYYHHSIDSIKRFNYRILHNPSQVLNRLINKKKIFPWIMIKSDS